MAENMLAKPKPINALADFATSQRLRYAQTIQMQTNQQAAKSGPYLTQLDPFNEASFQQWVAANKVPFDPSQTADYDMRGFYMALKNGDPIAATALNANDGQMHYPDYWKTPYHQSFSNESKFAGKDAPMWNDRDQLEAPSGRVVFDERAR